MRKRTLCAALCLCLLLSLCACARKEMSAPEVQEEAIYTLPELSPELQRRCVFAYGEKDSDLKECKKVLPAKYPGAELKVWPGYAHCGKMTADPEQYAAMLKQFMEQN